MSSRKYVEDYQTEYVLGPHGRMRAVARYAGKWFRFAAPAEELKRTRRLYAGLCAVMWLSFLLPLLFVSRAGDTMYAILPHACVLPPLAYFTMAVYGLLTEKQPMIRERSDHIYERTLHCSVGLLLFTGLSALGFLVLLVLRRSELLLPGDLIHGLAQIPLFGSALLLFRHKHDVRTEETDPPKED